MKKAVSVLLTVLTVMIAVSCAAGPGAGVVSQTEDTKPITADTEPDETTKALLTFLPDERYEYRVYVKYVCDEGLVFERTFEKEPLYVYAVYPVADGTFCEGDYLILTFYGADVRAEKKVFDDFTTDYTITECSVGYETAMPEKPIIYLYPQKDTVCSVKLDFDGSFTCTYPAYGEKGWRDITAKPDGTLIFPDGKRYYALYWEGIADIDFDLSRGFCVKGSNCAGFLSDILPKLGLNDREANEFIIYWLPRLQDNEYNFISFQNGSYEKSVKLTVEPAPDTVIRVFMAYRPLDHMISVEEQEIITPSRSGFIAVEWGGCEIK